MLQIDLAVDVPLCLPSHSEIRPCYYGGLFPRFAHMSLLPVDRVGGRQVGHGPRAYPSVIRGSMAARSHNYAATMRISLPVTAKEGLETYRERHKTCFFTAAWPRFCSYTAVPLQNRACGLLSDTPITSRCSFRHSFLLKGSSKQRQLLLAASSRRGARTLYKWPRNPSSSI